MAEGGRAHQSDCQRSSAGEHTRFRELESSALICLLLQTREQIEKATLDIEPRRIILNVPLLETLDIDLAMPDAQIMSVFGGSSDGNSALMLKRQRDLNVDGAKAEWHIQESVLYLYV